MHRVEAPEAVYGERHQPLHVGRDGGVRPGPGAVAALAEDQGRCLGDPVRVDVADDDASALSRHDPRGLPAHARP